MVREADEYLDEKIDMDPDNEGGEFEDRGDDFVSDGSDDDQDDVIDEDFDGDDEDDTEGGDEEDYDESEDDEDEEESPSPKNDVRIPKERFDEVIAQREEAREQNKLLAKQMEQLIDLVRQNKAEEKEQEAKPAKETFEYDFDAREADYMEAVLEGNTKEAASIRKEIRAAEKKMFSLEQEELVSKATETARSEARKLEDESKFEKLITASEEKYPFLNQSSDDYNQEAVDKINSLFNKLVNAGSSKSEALAEAVDLVAPVYHKPAKEVDENKPLGGKRSRKALKRNARANNAQPPRMKGKTSRDKGVDDYDILNMSESEYNKLPASVKKKLRGD